jgi:hypothetical protein
LVPAPEVNVPGSLGWVAEKFKSRRQFTREIGEETRRQYEYGLEILLKIERRSGIPMRHVQARELTPEVIEEIIKIVEEQSESPDNQNNVPDGMNDTDSKGNRAFHMIASWRRAFNVARPGNHRLLIFTKMV